MGEEENNTGKNSEGLEAQVAKLETELEKVRNQAARYRVTRNQALRNTYAFGRVLNAHKIVFDVNEADLKSLVIEDGQVSGEFSYRAPSTTKGNAPTEPPGEGTKALTMSDIQAMSKDQIKARLPEVLKAMDAQQGTGAKLGVMT